ncbi:pancreatic secretory granule membrane major glycoprotein GP2-like [Discoglossus pictus]
MKFFCIFVLATLLKHAGASCYNATDYPQCDSCQGECGPGNGCSCLDNAICIPTACAMGSNECCPPGLFWLNSCCSEDVACDPPCADDELCKDVNSVATCLCDESKYNKKNIADLVPILTCESDAMIVSLSRCLLDALGYNSSSFKLNNDSEICTFSYADVINNQSVQSIQVKPQIGWCGNSAMNDSSKLYYANTLHIGIQNKRLITINPIEMNFTCSYNLTMQTVLNAALHPILSTTNLPDANGNTSYPLTMAAYRDSRFTEPIQMSDTVNVGSYVYLGLFVSNADGDIFALKVMQCVATPTTKEDTNKVQLLSGGCAVDGEVETVVEENGKGLEARIRISSFAFQGFNDVNIFCDVRLCDKRSNNCTECETGRAVASNTREVMLSLQFEDNLDLSSSGSHIVLSWTVLASSLFILLSNKLF